ncbi:hypothetical protein Hdeb2414_s0006g00214761 [Helianthus debilis subsp. tardiflorus]
MNSANCLAPFHSIVPRSLSTRLLPCLTHHSSVDCTYARDRERMRWRSAQAFIRQGGFSCGSRDCRRWRSSYLGFRQGV